MSVIPKKNEDLLTFLNDRVEGWADNAVALSLDAASLQAWTAAVTAANADFSAASKARQAAKAAVLTQNASLRTVRRLTANLIREIRIAADRNANPDSIYSLAQLPPPAQPSPRPVPNQPTDLRATIDPTEGVLTLRWKAKDNAGTIYRVERATISASGELSDFGEIGLVGEKSFADETLPVGVAGVVYVVKGVRSRRVGPASSTLT
ncbi:MAG: hypothetical protein ACK55O_05955, partial [Phycisphaerales bacterium]